MLMVNGLMVNAAVAGDEATVDSCLYTPPNRKQFVGDPGRRNDRSVEFGANSKKCDSRRQPDLTEEVNWLCGTE